MQHDTPKLRLTFPNIQCVYSPRVIHSSPSPSSVVEDIDLYTGGLAEYPVYKGLVGPTFACIISDQFLRVKIGDRFWYETDELPQAFTEGEIL